MTAGEVAERGPREPKQHLGQLKSEVESLLEDYRQARREHKQSQALPPIAGELANRIFNIPARKAEKLFAPAGWRDAPEYSVLERRFWKLFQQVSSFLDSVAMRTSRGYRPKLAGSLKPVAQAVRLETRITKLIGVVERHDLDELVYLEDVPEPKRRRARRSKPQAAQHDAVLAIETAALAWVSVFVTSAAGFYFALAPVLEFLAIPAGVGLAGLLTFALLMTRKYWVPRFWKILEHR
jgi:hypothetical protein